MPEKPTVLFVDDVEEIFEAARALFQNEYEILRATDPDHACDIVRQRRGRVDVVVVDMWMPTPDGDVNKRAGLEVIERIKGREGQPGLDPDLPIIVLTAHGNIDDLRECLKAGASNYVLKGQTDVFERLQERIQAALDARLGRLARRFSTLHTGPAQPPVSPEGADGNAHLQRAITLLEEALEALRTAAQTPPASKPADSPPTEW